MLALVLTAALLANPVSSVNDLVERIGPRKATSDSERIAATYLADRLKSLGYRVEITEFPVKDMGTSRNVIAWKRSGPWHVVGAHYDSKRGPGADDNASGCAVLLELAAKFRDTDLPLLFVFFGAEEMVTGRFNDHHFGSRHLARALSKSDMLTMTNVDMVGMGPDLHVRSLAPNPHASALLAAAKKVNPRATWLRDPSGLSDHEAFERGGIPSAWLERRPSPYYHSPRDRKVRPEFLTEAVAILEKFFNGFWLTRAR